MPGEGKRHTRRVKTEDRRKWKQYSKINMYETLIMKSVIYLMSKIDKGLQTPMLKFQRSISSYSGMASSLL